MEAEIKNRIEQIRQGKVPAEYQKTPAGILPKSWKVTSLCNVLKKKNAKNKGRKYDRILTNSATKGIVPQTDYFDKQIANDENTEGYYVVEKGDFVYNPRISVSAPCGPFNKYYENETGIMSPLYSVYQFVDENVHYSEFLAQYFLSAYWYRYMNGIANYGARSDRMNVTQDMMDLMPLPYPPESEYKKIVRILLNQDRVIVLREKLLAEKLRQKQYLMQVLLTGKKRLPGFSEPWKEVKLGDIFSERTETNHPELELLAITGTKGVIPRNQLDLKDNSSEDKSKYLKICIGDIGYNTMRMWQGVSAYSNYEGIVSPAYTILKPNGRNHARFFAYLFKLPEIIFLFYRYSQGLVDDTRNLKYSNFKKIRVKCPVNEKEQMAIADILVTADQEIGLLRQALEQERRKKKALMQLLLSGIVRVKP